MRFVLTLGGGVVLGYVLHSKKDQPIEGVIEDVAATFGRTWSVVRKRFS